jgi:hypothetical protein
MLRCVSEVEDVVEKFWREKGEAVDLEKEERMEFSYSVCRPMEELTRTLLIISLVPSITAVERLTCSEKLGEAADARTERSTISTTLDRKRVKVQHLVYPFLVCPDAVPRP